MEYKMNKLILAIIVLFGIFFCEYFLTLFSINLTLERLLNLDALELFFLIFASTPFAIAFYLWKNIKVTVYNGTISVASYGMLFKKRQSANTFAIRSYKVNTISKTILNQKHLSQDPFTQQNTFDQDPFMQSTSFQDQFTQQKPLDQDPFMQNPTIQNSSTTNPTQFIYLNNPHNRKKTFAISSIKSVLFYNTTPLGPNRTELSQINWRDNIYIHYVTQNGQEDFVIVSLFEFPSFKEGIIKILQENPNIKYTFQRGTIIENFQRNLNENP